MEIGAIYRRSGGLSPGLLRQGAEL